MKICWDNLENVTYKKKFDHYSVKGSSVPYVYKELCKNCGEPFLDQKYHNGQFCSLSCFCTGKTNPFYRKDHSEEFKQSNSIRSRKQIGEKNPFYGRKHTKKSRQKMSHKRKGRVSTFLGKTHSNSSRKKISKSLKGKLCGSKNPNWKGGISTELYCKVFYIQEWRKIIFERDKNKICWNPQCLGNSTRSVLHHIDYDKQNCNPLNIVKICNSCNASANYNRGWWKSFYKEVMRRRFERYEND